MDFRKENERARKESMMHQNDDITLLDLKRLVSYNPLSGIFMAMPVRGSRLIPGSPLGTLSRSGYLAFRILGKIRRAHRLAWFMVHGEWPEEYIDHINGIKTDNRIANLRSVTQSVNMQNLRTANCRNSTGYLGVSWDRKRGKYRAIIGVNGKNLTLGWFDEPEVAHQAYLDAKRKLHPGCTI
jgi:hypothetical protein